MTPAQKNFMEQLTQIQSNEIGSMLCQLQEYPTTEELLTDFSYNLIYGIMELLDGYGPAQIKYELTDSVTMQIINGNLHDACEEFLKTTDL